MSKIQMIIENCVECGKPVQTPQVLPYDGKEKQTGMPYHQEGYDGFETEYLGLLCFDCANKLCNEGKIIIGYAGFPYSWEATLSPTFSRKEDQP
jgi:hypothetical protein